MPTRQGVSLTTRLFLSFGTPLLEKICLESPARELVLATADVLRFLDRIGAKD